MSESRITFPDGFIWGASSAAHQVEGGNDKNQWWEFEQKKGNIKNEDKSGVACDHYNRYEEDFEMLKELNHNAHRLSIEWSRLFPESPDTVDNNAVEHYHKVFEKLHQLGLEPFVTTFHFTIPLWFAKIGGFEKKENITYYENFVKFIAKEYKDEIKYWNTINEPGIYALQSYLVGEFPPAKKNALKAAKVMKILIKSHAKCYHAIKNENTKAKVGIVKHVPYFLPKHINNPFHRLGSHIADWVFNGIIVKALKTGDIGYPIGFMDKYDYIKNSSDFIGLNYYSKRYSTITNIGGSDTKTGKEETTKMGWTIFPEGIYQSIMMLNRELNIPIYVTENGIATDDDEKRTDYIKNHLQQIHRAIREGANVKGYFYWSNMDNFEWAMGYEPNFGIIGIDRENGLKRIVKDSAIAYSEIIKNNGF